MADCTLIYPHQLFDPHPAIERGRAVVLIEDSLFFGDPHVGIRFHQQKMVLHRASMKTYAARLERQGHEVIYLEHESGKSSVDSLKRLIDRGFRTFHLCEEADYLLRRRLQRVEEREEIHLSRHESPMFLTPREVLKDHFSGGKKPFMARFYREQRERMGLLLESDGSPRGGKWSFDEENRKGMPKKGLDLPPEPRARETRYVAEAKDYVQSRFRNYFGSGAGFSYPVSHDSADSWLEDFLERRFHLFGDYEDAISSEDRVLFHSVLTPLMNIGLLTPRQVVERAMEFAGRKSTPLNSVEGFVRQVIGWREFVFGAYTWRGVEGRTSNFWQFDDRPIPRSFYNGSTGIVPVDTVIRRVLEHGWCHHIERLMILGNFMLLCRFHPDRVYDWFMELFVDAYDWVMVPNVYGMSQFADGGVFTTKPYLSGSNYVRKMSNFAKGEWCEVWDGLFWSFIADYRSFFEGQHRLGMMAKQLARMKPDKLQLHRRNAAAFFSSLHEEERSAEAGRQKGR